MVARQALKLMAVLLLLSDLAESERPSLKKPGKNNLKKIPSLKSSSSFSMPVMVRDVTGSRVVPEDNFVFPRYIFSLGENSKYPKHPLRPGEDTVYPHLRPKKTKFPMAHLYSGDLYAHEDGNAFVAQDDAHLIEEEYDFEKSAAQTDKFIPYTYIIELKETYEDDLSPQPSRSFSTLDPSMQHHIKNLHATEHKPRLKSEEVLKKVEIFIEKGYDRGAYDHKGFEDHTSAWGKYNEHTEGKYGGGSSSRTREGESRHQHHFLPDDAGAYPHQTLGGSGTSLAPIKCNPSSLKDSPRHCTGKRVLKWHPLQRTNDRAVVIPTFKSKQQLNSKNNKSTRKGFSRPPSYFKRKYQKNKSANLGPNSARHSHQQKSSSNMVKEAPNKQSSFPDGFFAREDNIFLPDSSLLSHSKGSATSASETRFQPFPFDKLFAFPVYSSTYDNFHSKHTIPAFPFDDQRREESGNQMNSAPQFRHRSKRRPLSKMWDWKVPKSTMTNLIQFPSSKTLNSRNLQAPFLASKKDPNSINEAKFRPYPHKKNPSFDFDSHKTINIGLAFENTTENAFEKAREMGQPVELMRKEPCISPTPVTANFEFGRFKPKLGPPDWFEGEPHFLDPLEGQVDRLRESVYAPVLREALCL